MNKLQISLAALAAAGTLSLSTVAPASADSAASTRNIILGAAALAGLAIESNVSRKNAQTRNVSGYLPDGSAVYGDGHVVTQNGYSYYPGNNGQSVSCNNGSCSLASNNSNDQNNGRYYGNSGHNDNGEYNYSQYTNGQYADGRNNNGRYTNDRNSPARDRDGNQR